MRKINLKGKIINLRLVKEKDADFILKLRTNKELSKFISPTDINLEEQIKWLKNYKIRENKKDEFYFIIETKDGTPCGTVRIYNINYKNKETTWGSFILDKTRPDGASNEVIELSLNFILKILGLEKIYLDVRKENYKAIHIYEKNGFIRIGEDEENYYYFK
ncbi:GNAT family N-acetyltransferase [Fusobacterium mortiferum]|jgi:RimJ/RimL family protein N-acetyltransferase|uniref:GNAT family N-acetyltransferase n=1 Tax=Fusobacterium mortiferum TaxID=850 RepID=UPI00164E9552|nr:GNAT family N-acetyltransferase [Fusobacterium mortiferum]